ncbi:MAG: Tfp pilus assembly protein FimT/FimU [Planctomycetota bacterium]
MVKPSAAPTAPPQRGFTLLEMILVITILGALMAMVLPSLEGISPKYRLRSAARTVGSSINWAKSLAGGLAKTHVLHYDLETQQFWIIQPPRFDQDPEMPYDERDTFLPTDLPEHIKIKHVVMPDGTVHDSGGVDVPVDSLGYFGSHIVVLINEDERLLSVKYNALVGAVDFTEGEARFSEF